MPWLAHSPTTELINTAINLGIMVSDKDNYHLEREGEVRRIFPLNICAENRLKRSLSSLAVRDFELTFSQIDQERRKIIQCFQVYPILQEAHATTDWPQESLHSTENHCIMELETYAADFERALGRIDSLSAVDWDGKPVKRSSFDYAPGDRPQVPRKRFYEFWKE